MATKSMSKRAKIEKALLDPEYRMELLVKGDRQINEIINSALFAVELIFRAAAEGAGLRKTVQTLHSKKANHQSCHM